MTDVHRSDAGMWTLEDQAFLKQMGISCVPSGQEFLLTQKASAKEDLAKVEIKSQGLQIFELNEDTLVQLSEERNVPIEILREELTKHRDMNP